MPSPQLPQYIDVFPRRIPVEPDSHGRAEQVDGAEEGAPVFGPHVVFEVFSCLPMGDETQDVAIFCVQTDPAGPAPVLLAHHRKECLKGLKKLLEFILIGPDFNGQFHALQSDCFISISVPKGNKTGWNVQRADIIRVLSEP